jgi:hypothetical protein
MSCGCNKNLNPCGGSQDAYIDASGCGNIVPATPQGAGVCCDSSCPEDHCQKIYYQQFYASVRTDSPFNMPTCGGSAVVSVVNLKAIAIGSFLWSAVYGYLEVTNFNLATGQVTLSNNCETGNAAPGTQVPGCTEFTVVDPPNAVNVNSLFIPYVALDFVAPPVAPAPGNTINIAVTSIVGLITGATVIIGTGKYLLVAIIDSTHITIQNIGLGITPGTSVIAKNLAGEYQYLVTANLSPFNDWTAYTPVVVPTASMTVTLVAGLWKYLAVNTIDIQANIFCSFSSAIDDADITMSLPNSLVTGGLTIQSVLVQEFAINAGPVYVYDTDRGGFAVTPDNVITLQPGPFNTSYWTDAKPLILTVSGRLIVV